MGKNVWLDVDGVWNNTANWSLGTVPVSTDDVIIASGSKTIAAFDAHTVVLNSLTIKQGFTGTIEGLQIAFTTGYFGVPSNTGVAQNGSGRIVIDSGTNQFTAYVYQTGKSPLDAGLAALRLKGTHASNKIIASGGITDVGTNLATDVATISECDIVNGARVNYGPGVTWTTVNVSDRSTFNTLSGGGTTLNVSDSSVAVVNGTTKVVNVYCNGNITYNIRPGSGNVIDNLYGYSDGTIDFSQNPSSGTIGTAYVYSGFSWWNADSSPNHIAATSIQLQDTGRRKFGGQ